MTVLLVVFGIAALGVLFTDTQWADIQSVVNFAILCYLSYRQQKTRKELPEATAEAVSSDGHLAKVAQAVVDRLNPETWEKMAPRPKTPPPPPPPDPPLPPPTPIH